MFRNFWHRRRRRRYSPIAAREVRHLLRSGKNYLGVTVRRTRIQLRLPVLAATAAATLVITLTAAPSTGRTPHAGPDPDPDQSSGRPAETAGIVEPGNARGDSIGRAETGCVDVLAITARGSGQSLSGSLNDNEMDNFYARLQAQVSPYRTIARRDLDASEYPAESVNVLKPGNAVRNLLLGGHVAAATAEYLHRHVNKFTAGMNRGVNAAVSAITAAATACPEQRLVLVGYSQGAMVMHKALRLLVERHGEVQLNRIAAAVLIADGFRTPNNGSSTTGAPAAPSESKGVGAKFLREPNSPASVADRVFHVCTKHDPVCDFDLRWMWKNAGEGTRIHGSYASSNLLTKTADLVRSYIRMWPKPAPVEQTIDWPIGTFSSSKLGVDVLPPRAELVRWKVTESTLPRGVSLTSDGWLQGTPGRQGLYEVRYTVTAIADPPNGIDEHGPTTGVIHLNVGGTKPKCINFTHTAGDITVGTTITWPDDDDGIGYPGLNSWTGTIHWGDGTSSPAVKGGHYSHTYNTPGSYPARIVGDGDYGDPAIDCHDDYSYTQVVKPSDTLWVNQGLYRGQYLQSSDGRYTLHLQAGDGNLVLYNSAGRAIWTTGKLGGQNLVLQGDSNLVVYRADGVPLWAANTVGRGVQRLVVQSDGNMVLYTPSGGAVWATNTVGR